jgi:uncharacterized protein YggE
MSIDRIAGTVAERALPLAILLAVVAFSSMARAQGQTIQISKENRTVAITATDTAEAMADRAVVTVGFTLYGKEQEQTYADGTRVSNAIVQALHGAGVKDEAIESAEQSLTAIDDNDKVRYASGLRFVCAQRWLVTVPAGRAAEVLHTAITAGANNSGGIAWELADDRELAAEAATKALADAQQMAERMVTGLHARLGPLVYASNQEEPRPGVFALARTEAARGKTEILQPLAIRPGKITRSATVYAVFALE